MTKESESYVQSAVRLEAGRTPGVKLWRNNVGVLLDATGRPVRYGLANETAEINRILKSGDLIGWRSVLITPADVGRTIAQFLSRECKPADWKPARPTDKARFAHEQAQRAWAQLVIEAGGDAKFATGEGTI